MLFFIINYATHWDLLSHIIVLNPFPRSRQFVGLISRHIRHRSSRHSCSTLSHLSVLFFLLYWTYSSLLVPLNSQILLECSDIRIELLWVLIYICSGPFIYNWDIKLMHVFTSLLKVEFHRIFPRDCTVGLHKAGPPRKSREGVRVESCQLGIRALGF